MRRLFSLIALTGLLLLPLGVTAPVKACSCIQLESLEQTANMADAVFYGKVLSSSGQVDSEKSPEQVIYSVEVYQSWKGEFRDALVNVSTSGSSAACGVNLTLDQEYIFMAGQSDNQISIGLCGGTTPATTENLGQMRESFGDGNVFYFTQNPPKAPDRPETTQNEVPATIPPDTALYDDPYDYSTNEFVTSRVQLFSIAGLAALCCFCLAGIGFVGFIFFVLTRKQEK